MTGASNRRTMSQTRFPPGWDEERTRKVLEHYEKQTEEAIAEDEATHKVVESDKEAEQ